MKQPPRQASLPLNKPRNVLRVKYPLQQFAIILQNLNRNRRLHLPHKLIYLPLLQPHQYLLRLKYPPPHIPIVLRLLLIQPLHTLQYAISQRHVLVNPLLALLYVLADCCELEDGLDQLQHVHYHELHALWYTVQVVRFVQLVTRVKYVVYLQGVFWRVADYVLCRRVLLVDKDSRLVHQQVVVDQHPLRAEVKCVPSKIIQLVHIDPCLLVRNQLELPPPHPVRSSMNQFYHSLHLWPCDRPSLDQLVMLNNVPENQLASNLVAPLVTLFCRVLLPNLSLHYLPIKRMTKRPVTNIVHNPCQCYCENRRFLLLLWNFLVPFRVVLYQQCYESLRQMPSPQTVLESCVSRSRKNMRQHSKLFNVP